MSKEFVKNILTEDADDNVPVTANLWPAIYNQARLTKPSAQIHRQSRWPQIPANQRPMLLGSAVALMLIAFITLAVLVQPSSVSAEEVLARAEQAAKGSATGLQSFYGKYRFQYRNNPADAFTVSEQETWFQAPDKYAYKITTVSTDGQASTISNGADSNYSYNYVSDSNQLRLRDAGFALFHGDPATATVQNLLFSPVSLVDALDRARRKTPPPLSPKSDPRPPYMYDAKLVGDEETLGRRTYVLEMTLVPGASLQSSGSLIPNKMKMWIDREVYAILQIEGWDASGNVMQKGAYESFQVNQGDQIDILTFLAPPNADIIDLRPVDEQDTDKIWQEVAQQASYQVFKATSVPDGLMSGRPFYDTEREVISQVYQGRIAVKLLPRYDITTGKITEASPQEGQQTGTRQATLPRLTIVQGPPASIKEDGLGQGASIQVGNLTGRFYTQANAHTLVFDVNGTRIKLYAPVYKSVGANQPIVFTGDQLAQIADAMQLISNK